LSESKDVIEYIDRETGERCRETVLGDRAMRWAYRTLSGRAFSPLLFGTSLPSRLLGWYLGSRFSRGRIAKTIADLGIDESEFATPADSFRSFNDFFVRRLVDGARPCSDDPADFPSPADGRLLVYDDLGPEDRVAVKGVESTLHDLFDRPLDDFDGGRVAVVRLCPADYHRYHFPCDATVAEQVRVRGRYDSVNPVALDARERIFCRNKRSYTLLDSDRFGRLAYMEVGAFGVAGIHQTFEGTEVRRMQEKGYFDFGGSTVVLVFQRDAIRFDEDLVAASREGVETLVKVGATIGRAAT